MGEINYAPLIRDMTWSYSRVKSFNDCPYGWYLRYIMRFKSDPKFYASYGSFMHKLIEGFYSGKLTKQQMLIRYYSDFQSEVAGYRPPESTLQKYIQAGAGYLMSFSPLPYNMIAVEDKIDFNLCGKPFTAIIDYLGEKDGDLYLIDNKSRVLKPRSGKAKPTANDKLLDEMLRQLYIYCDAVKEKYGRFPKYLGFNCFRSGDLIIEEFDEKAHDEAVAWVRDTIIKIENTNEFAPRVNSFACFWICGLTRLCEHFQNNMMERRVRK